MGAVKTQNIPVELRTWWKSFQVAAYRHDYSAVFHDFVTMALTQFCVKDEMFEEWHADAMRRYNRQEKDAFNEMFFEMLNVFKEAVTVKDNPYYDLFGHIYETLASSQKKSGLGQFFTPETIVEMIVHMQTQGLETGQGKRIVDPTCGSGRMLFIAHVYAPGNYVYGIDIDPLCAKMSAINMMLHGCVGEVVCGNGLWLEHDWRFALAINTDLSKTGIPSIRNLEKEHSFVWHQWKHSETKEPKRDEQTKQIQVDKNEKTDRKSAIGSQLSIF
ncbi:MAG: class I SAM-dependent DNA methyltransferase [Flavobacteriales bacterium]